MVATAQVCYAWDAFDKVVLRFDSPDERKLWIDLGSGGYERPDERQEIDESNYVVRQVQRWATDRRGYDVGLI